jgi:hypothetical protein
MKDLWQRFVSLVGPDPDAAGVTLLVAAFAVVASLGLIVHCVISRHYTAAIGLVAALGGVTGICLRDYRRGRWSVISGVIVVIWILLSGAVLMHGS